MRVAEEYRTTASRFGIHASSGAPRSSSAGPTAPPWSPRSTWRASARARAQSRARRHRRDAVAHPSSRTNKLASSSPASSPCVRPSPTSSGGSGAGAGCCALSCRGGRATAELRLARAIALARAWARAGTAEILADLASWRRETREAAVVAAGRRALTRRAERSRTWARPSMPRSSAKHSCGSRSARSPPRARGDGA